MLRIGINYQLKKFLGIFCDEQLPMNFSGFPGMRALMSNFLEELLSNSLELLGNFPGIRGSHRLRRVPHQKPHKGCHKGWGAPGGKMGPFRGRGPVGSVWF